MELVSYVNDVAQPVGQVLMTCDANGNYKAAYAYGLERTKVDFLDNSRPESQDPLYYLYDGLGSVSQLITPAGNQRAKYDYEPFGLPLTGGKLPGENKNVLYNPSGYTGEQHDHETDFIYLRARYYDPGVGRFLSKDTYPGQLTDPLSQHLYVYCGNNPVIYVDPLGYCKIADIEQNQDYATIYIRYNLYNNYEENLFYWRNFYDPTGKGSYTDSEGYTYYFDFESPRGEILVPSDAVKNYSRQDAIWDFLRLFTSSVIPTSAAGAVRGLPGVTKGAGKLVDDLPSGWTKTTNNGFTHVKDANGNIRVRIDPPDAKTPYPHKHLYDEAGNSLDINGNIVSPKSPDAHIPLK